MFVIVRLTLAYLMNYIEFFVLLKKFWHNISNCSIESIRTNATSDNQQNNSVLGYAQILPETSFFALGVWFKTTRYWHANFSGFCLGVTLGTIAKSQQIKTSAAANYFVSQTWF